MTCAANFIFAQNDNHALNMELGLSVMLEHKSWGDKDTIDCTWVSHFDSLGREINQSLQWRFETAPNSFYEYLYDGQGRLSQIKLYDYKDLHGNPDTTCRIISYKYDERGDIIEDWDGPYYREYDSLGRTVVMYEIWDDTLFTKFTYDDEGRVTMTTESDSRLGPTYAKTEYSYNGNSDLRRIKRTHYDFYGKRPYVRETVSIAKYTYLSNGLVDTILTKYVKSPNHEKEELNRVSRFEYIFN
jgi:hypothetical protein